MRVRSYVGKQLLHILIDCGSKTSKKLVCKLISTTPFRVDAANGNKRISSFECKKLKCNLKGYDYEADCMLVPLGRCDMVMEIKWFFTLGDINCNVKDLTMKFNHNGKRIVLKGSQNGSLKWIQGKQIIKEGVENGVADALSRCSNNPELNALTPHRQVTMRKSSYNKMSSKYYWPFQIIKKVGQVTYELEWHASSQIHKVFHVTQLKKCTHPVVTSGALLDCDTKGLLIKTLVAILERRLGKLKNSPVMYVLVQWSGDSVDDAT
ncbi:hypothetical protein Tco_1354222 [Tanacetum coccineum]